MFIHVFGVNKTENKLHGSYRSRAGSRAVGDDWSATIDSATYYLKLYGRIVQRYMLR